ncbi:MAG: hypothetical protein KDA45_09580 [Planctomycetales bacterium]|nr:hypothetical protein [Planctomycetales bacterium]
MATTEKRPHDRPANPHHSPEGVGEIVEASVKGEDEPMEREHPAAPGALVWFSYPLLLVVLLIVALAAAGLWWRW